LQVIASIADMTERQRAEITVQRSAPGLGNAGGESEAFKSKLATERELRASQRLLQTVFDTFPYSTVVKDRQGRYLMVNKAWCRFYNTTPEQVLQRNSWEVPRRPGDESQFAREEDLQVLAGAGQGRTADVAYTSASGEWAYVRSVKEPFLGEDGQVAGLVAVYVNQTAEKVAQEKADTARAQLFDAMESLPASFFMFNVDLRLVMWNSRVREFFPDLYKILQPGLGFAEVLQAAFGGPGIPAEVEELGMEEWIRQVGQDSAIREIQMADGRWLQVQNRRMSDGGIVWLGFDVTALKRQEQELRQAQKMEALGQLTGGVAHDFNNLLQIIESYTDFAMEGLDPSDARLADLKTAREAGERAAQLTQQLLAFSRKQVLRKTLLPLSDIAEGLTKMLGRVLRDDIALTLNDDPSVEPVLADRGMVEQVIMNLAVNARDAMPKGGKIVLGIAAAHVDSEYCRSYPAARPGRYAVLSVADGGVGMTPEIRSRVFEPFFTTKPAGKGTGLGLSTVFGIVQQHGGFVRLETEVGRGTTFFTYWPIAEPDYSEAANDAGRTVRGGTETLLVAEDNERVRAISVRVLRQAGYTVHSAIHGEEAVQVFAAHAGAIKLVVLDMMMPVLNGPDCFEKMRRIDPGLRAVFCSGWYSEEEEALIATRGIQVVHKPFATAELLKAVRTALDAKAPFAARPTKDDQ
jgi:two-component system, cell cycle sensor histidine kinase and response regulator CckA